MCCHIHGFQPYFYAAMPSNFAPDDVEAFRKVLNVRSFVCSCVRSMAELSHVLLGPNERRHERPAEAASLRDAR